MPDITLRFHKDMLVLSSPVEPVLERQGFDLDLGLELASLIEPESIREALRLSVIAGAQCIVTNTAGLTSARLAHRNMEDRAEEVVEATFGLVHELKPQHLLIEVGPCGLPLDSSSKNSLNEHRAQYARVARLCNECEFDAFFLNGFRNPVDLKCALMGIRQISRAPIFASVNVQGDGTLADRRHTLDEAYEIMVEYEASVAGFATEASLDQAVALAKTFTCGTLPVLVQLKVNEIDPKQGEETPENPYYCADTMVDAGTQLHAAGVQFLRACGEATPAYTGALVAASEGLDVVPMNED